MTDADATDPGLTQNPDGSFSIGPKAAEKSRKRAEDEAIENAKRVLDEIEHAPKAPDGS